MKIIHTYKKFNLLKEIIEHDLKIYERIFNENTVTWNITLKYSVDYQVNTILKDKEHDEMENIYIRMKRENKLSRILKNNHMK